MRFLAILVISLIITTVFSACATTREIEKPFTVDINSPKIPIDTIEVQFDNTMFRSGLRKVEVAVSYFPLENAVCLEYRLDSITYHLFFDWRGRAAFINALEQYKQDFEQRNFERNTRQSRRHYDTVQGYLFWQRFRFSVQAEGEVGISIGYFFKDRRPYFTITQREAVYIDPQSQRDMHKSGEITMYFTRAQADALAALFSEQHLRGLSNNRSLDSFLNSNTDFDDY